jgi:hypothetical protein
MKLKNLLTEAESFTATNKKTGKTSVFKTKDSRDSAIKAGTHDKVGGAGDSKKSAKGGVNIFDKPADKPKAKSKAKSAPADMGVDKVVYNTKTKTVGIVRMADERGETKTDADGNVNTSDLEPYNPTKFPHQKDAQVAPSTQKEVDKRGLWNPFASDEPTKSVQAKGGAGSGRDSKEIAKAKKQLKKDHPDWDDSKINQTARALMGHTRIGKKPFKKKEEPKVDEPKAATPSKTPTEARKGNPQVNVAAKKTAEKYGITPQKLGNEKYKEAMFQAAVSALTDSNFHSEARELVAAIEGKPEFAKKPEYPSIKDPKYKEKMADIRKNSADGSVYMNGTGDIDDYGTDVSQASGWDGVDAADGIAFTLRMNGFHKEADMIQSVFNDKPYMKESKTSLKSIMRK